LLVALSLQAATYLAQAEIWRRVGRKAGTPIRLLHAYKLALAKLFVDQVLPSGGASGRIVVAQVLERSAFPRRAVLAGVVVNTTSFFIAYIASLGIALVVFARLHKATAPLILSCGLFMAVGAAVTFAMLAITGKDVSLRLQRLARYEIVRPPMTMLHDADRSIVRDPGLQMTASACQLLTFALDGATLWALPLLGPWQFPFRGVRLLHDRERRPDGQPGARRVGHLRGRSRSVAKNGRYSGSCRALSDTSFPWDHIFSSDVAGALVLASSANPINVAQLSSV
jgi:hypothetical protein